MRGTDRHMATVIGPKANPKRIIQDARHAFRAGQAAGNEVGAMTAKHLEPALADYAAAEAAETSATEAEAVAQAAVKAEETKTKEGVGMVEDVMWNLLGRPRRSALMKLVFPRGSRPYLVGPATERSAMTQILVARLGDVPTSSRITEDTRKGWIEKLEGLRASSEAAVLAHRPLRAAARVARSSRLAAVAAVQAALMALKREMITQGMSEAKIHEVIPDASPRTSSAGGSPETPPPAKTGDGGNTAG